MASILNRLIWPSSLGSIFSSLMVSQIILYLQKFGKMSLATIVQSHKKNTKSTIIIVPVQVVTKIINFQ